MGDRRMLVDPACRALADHFLADVKGSTTEHRIALAEEFQRAADDFCRTVEERHDPSSRASFAAG